MRTRDMQTGWHLLAVNADGVPFLYHGDTRTPKIGHTLTVSGEPIPCEHGLHFCKSPLGAIYQRWSSEPNMKLCYVRLGGIIKLSENDHANGLGTLLFPIGVAQERTIVSWRNAAPLVRRALNAFIAIGMADFSKIDNQDISDHLNDALWNFNQGLGSSSLGRSMARLTDGAFQLAAAYWEATDLTDTAKATYMAKLSRRLVHLYRTVKE